jgi:hypothetical protein
MREGRSWVEWMNGKLRKEEEDGGDGRCSSFSHGPLENLYWSRENEPMKTKTETN